MWWWDGTGIWNITAYIADNSADSGTNTSQKFYIGTTTGVVASPANLNFPSIVAGATDSLSNNDPIILNNTGNLDRYVEVNSTNLLGETNASFALWASNFTVNIADACEGTAMQDHNYVNITGNSLPAGNFTPGNGTAQEELYFCLEQAGPELTVQSYSTSAEGSWTIRIFLVAVIPARRRKRKKKIEDDKLVQALNLLAEELKEEYSREKEGVIKLLIKEIKKKYRLNNEEIRELVEIRREINVPTGIFTKKIGALETISKYMKENLNMNYKEIAEELNRDERTIWTAYNKARKKQPKPLEVKETKMFLPLSIFKNRKLTILESIIVYLKEEGMKYNEIAELLGRDQRNIWTIYSKARKKQRKILK
jgi:DNA-binding CsgD family transcriptional regulator